MNNFDTQMDNLIEEWWESFLSDYYCYLRDRRVNDSRDEAIDFLNEFVWEQAISLKLALYVMTTHSDQIDWDFFGDIYDDAPGGGGEAVRNQAIWLILKYHLTPRAEQKWAKPPEPKVKEVPKEIWKGTLDPDKIKKQGDICEPYRKDNRNDLYTRHPYK